MQREIFIDTGTSRLFVIKDFTANYFNDLTNVISQLNYEPEIEVCNKICTQHRNIGFYSNDSIGYMYSKRLMKSQPLNDKVLVKLLNQVNKELGTQFNGILVNEYTDGEKYIGKHSDDEKDLDKKTLCVAGIAYGATRTFRIRDIETRKIVKDIQHEPCMLIVMDGDFQKEFTHEIPQQKKIKESRVSLTFRHHTK